MKTTILEPTTAPEVVTPDVADNSAKKVELIKKIETLQRTEALLDEGWTRGTIVSDGQDRACLMGGVVTAIFKE